MLINHFMDYLKTKHIFRASFILSVLSLTFNVSAIDTKRFDAPPIPRDQYLTFSQPDKLRYSALPLDVDRRKLLMPGDMKLATVTVIVQTDENASVSMKPDFPLIGGNEGNSSTSPVQKPLLASNPVNPNPVLPLSDPFGSINSSSINSTDELLQVFESSDFESPRGRMQNIPFVPPYTISTDSMRITNRATYKRIQR